MSDSVETLNEPKALHRCDQTLIGRRYGGAAGFRSRWARSARKNEIRHIEPDDAAIGEIAYSHFCEIVSTVPADYWQVNCEVLLQEPVPTEFVARTRQ